MGAGAAGGAGRGVPCARASTAAGRARTPSELLSTRYLDPWESPYHGLPNWPSVAPMACPGSRGRSPQNSRPVRLRARSNPPTVQANQKPQKIGAEAISHNASSVPR